MFKKHWNNIRAAMNKCDRKIDSIDTFVVDELQTMFTGNAFSHRRNRRLTRPLKKKKFSIDYSDFMIYNYDDNNDSPLIAAIKNEEDDAVIRTLIEKEANLEPPLCFALQKNSTNIVEILLDAGCSLNGCNGHASVIHCYLENPRSGLREDMLDLLIQRGVDLKMVDSENSLLCFALSRGADVNDIKLLLKKGVKFNCCMFHNSPMLCLTNTEVGRPIKESVIKLLHDLGAKMNVVDYVFGYTPIEHALYKCNYEIGALKLLLKLHTVNAKMPTDNLLHHAVVNPKCNLELVKFLVSQGIKVNNIDSCRETPLHCAAKNNHSEEIPSIIQFLVEEGCPINEKNNSGHTPLGVAVTQRSDYEIFMVLLTAGAEVGRTDEDSTLWMAQKSYYGEDGIYPGLRLEWFQLCLKFAYLQNKNFDLKDLVRPGEGFDKFCSFAEKCVSELQTMESKSIGHSRTLREFTDGGFFLPQKNAEVNSSELNQLLGILGRNSFPIYNEVIAARVNRQALIEKLDKVSVFSVSCKAEKITLNYVCLQKIAVDLDGDDLLSFVAAFYVLNNHIDDGISGNGKLEAKKNC